MLIKRFTKVVNTYGLNLPSDEIIWHRINTVVYNEEQTIRKDFTYSGTRWTSKALKAGTLSVLSRKTKDFQSQDATRLFITNKRIIFVRKQKNVTKSINIQSINLLQFV